jgi:hypothetical protein
MVIICSGRFGWSNFADVVESVSFAKWKIHLPHGGSRAAAYCVPKHEDAVNLWQADCVIAITN